MRFDPEATTLEGAARYLAERAVQMLKHGAVLNSLEALGDEAVLARWWVPRQDPEDPRLLSGDLELQGDLASIYLLKQHRGKGRYQQLAQEVGLPILTYEACHLSHFLNQHDIPYLLLGDWNFEYSEIEHFYGDRKAERSQVWLMRHIDEGLGVLRSFLGSGERLDAPSRGYCLHPLVQSDDNLTSNWDGFKAISPTSVVLAMEYRAVANASLSHFPIPSAGDIKLSVLPQVNEMLVADKVQNRKDFEQYHKGTHPRSAELERYFRLWLERLGIPEETYQRWVWDLGQPQRVLAKFLGGAR